MTKHYASSRDVYCHTVTLPDITIKFHLKNIGSRLNISGGIFYHTNNNLGLVWQKILKIGFIKIGMWKILNWLKEFQINKLESECVPGNSPRKCWRDVSVGKQLVAREWINIQSEAMRPVCPGCPGRSEETIQLLLGRPRNYNFNNLLNYLLLFTRRWKEWGDSTIISGATQKLQTKDL